MNNNDTLAVASVAFPVVGIGASAGELTALELRLKVAEMSRASNDMRNLLDSTEIAILFLNETLHVRRFTPATTKIFKLIPGDTGRSITDIVSDLDYPGMTVDALEVLRTLVFTEKAVSASESRWFRVRVMPYRTQDNRIDGLVITFSDISVSKNLEIELRQAQARLQRLAVSSDFGNGGHGLP